jgi:hypothetical protein
MRMRWSLALPAAGLTLFAALTYHSFRWNREVRNGQQGRYFWWSSIRLDSDPLNRRPKTPTPTSCEGETADCVGWDPQFIWIEPGWMAKLLVLSAFPAFAAGAGVVRGLASLGISEISTFMVSMPVFILAWFYIVGWIIDRWRRKRRAGRATPISPEPL